MVFPGGWRRRQKITIDHTKLAGDETNFAVCLVWNGATATSNINSEIVTTSTGFNANADGSDIRASSDAAGLTQLPVDVAIISTNADAASAYVEIYVKISSISSASDTVFYLWYNNAYATAPAVTSTYGRNAVWSDFIAVLHMGPDYVDSTGNGWDITTDSGTEDSRGALGSGRLYTSGDYMTIGNTGLWGKPTDLSYFAFVSNTSTGGAGSDIVNAGGSPVSGVWCRIVATTGAARAYYNYQVTPTVANRFCENTSLNIIGAGYTSFYTLHNPSASNLDVYVNGTGGTAQAYSDAILWADSGEVRIGHHIDLSNAATNFVGVIEEVRVRSTIKDSNYITTMDNAIRSPQTFVKSYEAQKYLVPGYCVMVAG
jgi:hypothetical protein